MKRKAICLLFAFAMVLSSIRVNPVSASGSAAVKSESVTILKGGYYQQTLQSGKYKITDNVTFEKGLVIPSGATVYIDIPAGLTLTCNGQDAGYSYKFDGVEGGIVVEPFAWLDESSAGIVVEEGATLILSGDGNLVANGGDGLVAEDGFKGYSYASLVLYEDKQTGRSSPIFDYGDGGAGGAGGYAPSPAIGGNGGAGGQRTNFCKANADKINYTETRVVETANNGYNGNNGEDGGSMGTVYILDSLHVTATAGTNYPDAGNAGVFSHYVDYATKGSSKSRWHLYTTVGAPGGGGGGSNESPIIGGGGAGGGSGGAGTSGSISASISNSRDIIDNMHQNASAGSGNNGGAGGISDAASMNRAPVILSGGEGGLGGSNGNGGTLYISATASVNDITGDTLTQSDLGETTNQNAGQAANVKQLTRVTVTVKTDGVADGVHSVSVRAAADEYELSATDNEGEFYGYVPSFEPGFTVFVDGSDSGFAVNTDVDATAQTVNFYTGYVHVKRDGTLEAGHSVTLTRNNSLIGALEETSTEGVFSGIFLERYDSELNKYNIYVDGQDSQCILHADKTNASERTVECNYYTAKVTVKKDGGEWLNSGAKLNVSLRGDNKTINMMPTANAGEFTTVLFDADTTDYTVYVNNVPSEQTISVSTLNTTVDYYTATLQLSLDGEPFKGATVVFKNGSYSYTVSNGTDNGTYCDYKVALPEAIKGVDSQVFTAEIAGVVDSSTHSVTSSSKTTSADFVSVKYYTSSIDADTGKIVENSTLHQEYAVLSGSTINPSVAPYLKGMTFSCWNKTLYDEFEVEADQTGFDFTAAISASTKLYAHFKKPNVQLNGAVRCDEDGTINSNGLYYYLPNLYITGYAQTDGIRYIKAEFTNIESIAFATDYPDQTGMSFDSLNGVTSPIPGVFTDDDTVTIEFSESISVAQAQEYLRRVLVKPTLDAQHKLTFTVSDSVLSLYNREDYAYTTKESDAYTKITSQTTAGTVLESGYYYVSEDVTLDGGVGGTKNAGNGGTNGLVIAENATVTIYIPQGKTLTVTGANGNGQTGGKAGILLPSTSTLTVVGEGTLIANGGNGGNAGNGSYATVNLENCVHSRWRDGGQNFQSAGGSGGPGSYGGGGGGAGIGTDGGQGGAAVYGGGGPSVASYLKDANKGKGTYYGGGGANGNAGVKADDCGNFQTYGITVQASGGTAGTAGAVATSYLSYQIVGSNPLSSSGYWTWGQMYSAYASYADIYNYGVYTNGVLGAGGGGGGAGYAGRDIGNGGTGGGSGGGGVAGGIIISPSANQYIKSNGGKGGSGSTNGADAGTNIANGAAVNPNAAGLGGASDNTGKEITSSDATLSAAPVYTVTFDATKFGGAKTVVDYNYFTGGPIALPAAVSVEGLVFLGWKTTTYGSNLNGDVTDCTKGDTKIYSASAINLSANTSGNIVLEPVFDETAAKYAVGSLTTTIASAASSITYETYKVYTKLNGTACDVDSLILKNGVQEYNLSSNGNGEYTLIGEAGKEFAIWCNGVDTEKKIEAGSGSETVELITLDIDVRLNDVSTDTLGVVTLVGGSDSIELTPVFTTSGAIDGNHAITMASSAATYDVYLDGTDTGKDVELSSSAVSMTLNYYTIEIRTMIDDSLTEIGTVTLRNNDTAESVLSTALTGVYQLTKAEEDTSYTIYIGSENAGKTVSFTHEGYKPMDESAYVINYRTIVVNTKDNGTAQNLGTVKLEKIGDVTSSAVAVPNTSTGVYEVTQLEDSDAQYRVSIGGIMTDEVVQFTQSERNCTLSSITLSLETTLNDSPAEVGSVVLKTADKPDINMIYQNGLYKATTLLPAEYAIYVDEKDTGVRFDTASTTTATLKYYTLHYDVDGGNANVPGDRAYLDGSKVMLASAIPTKDNFQFVGWNDNSGELITTETTEITVSAERHTLTASYNSTGNFDTRYKTYGGEWIYADLKDVLAMASADSSKNIEVELLKNTSLDTDSVIPSKVSLTIPSGITLSGNFTNQGTVKLNGALDGTVNNFGTIEGCGTASEDFEILAPANIGTLNNQGAGSVSGCKIAFVENNSGSLKDCHIVSGTAVEGFLLGTIYAQAGVTFGDSVAPQNGNGEKANISLEGGGTLNSFEEINNADLFAGLMTEYDQQYHSLATIHLRNRISVSTNQLYAKQFTFIAPENTEYDEEEKKATITADYIESTGKISAVYYRSANEDGSWSDWTTAVPKEVGTYQVKIDVADGLYFTGMNGIKDGSWTYSIEPHIHTFAEDWTMDDTCHWHAATCKHTDEVSDKEAHTFGEWTSNNNATDADNETKSRVCSICGYVQTVNDDANNQSEIEGQPNDLGTNCYCHYIIAALAALSLAGIWLLRKKNLKISVAILAVDLVASGILTLCGSCSADVVVLIGNLALCTGSFAIQLKRK